MSRAIALMFIAGAALWCLWIAVQVLWFALKTGRLIRRNGYASRRDRPLLYWGGVAFWGGTTALAVATAAMLVKLGLDH